LNAHTVIDIIGGLFVGLIVFLMIYTFDDGMGKKK